MQTRENLLMEDPLTGLSNRQVLLDALALVRLQAETTGECASVLWIDVDQLAPFNDKFGFPAGDQVMQELGRLLTQEVRAPDMAARVGGNEFIVLLRKTELSAATQIAERLRTLASCSLVPKELRQLVGPMEMTVSIGVATNPRNQAWNSQTLIELANRRCYDAKKAGRNRVIIANAPRQPGETGPSFNAPFFRCVSMPGLMAAFASLHEQSNRRERCHSLLAILVDDFVQRVQSVIGLGFSDSLSRHITELIAQAVGDTGLIWPSSSSICYEFAVLLPDTETADAVQVAEKIRAAVAHPDLLRISVGQILGDHDDPAGQALVRGGLPLSVAVATTPRGLPWEAESLLERALRQVRAIEESGGNRVVAIDGHQGARQYS